MTTTTQETAKISERTLTILQCVVTQPDLAHGLKFVKDAISTRSTLPILQHVLIEGNLTGRLTLSGTNLEAWHETIIPGNILVMDPQEVASRRSMTIDFKWLFALVSTVAKTESIEIKATCIEETTEQENGKKKITRHSFKIKLVTSSGRKQESDGMDPEEFPCAPDVDLSGLPAITFKDQSFLLQLVAEVTLATADDDSRPVLTGVHFHQKKDKLCVEGADSFRLSRRIVSVEGLDERFNCLIPGYSLLPAIKALTPVKTPQPKTKKGEKPVFTPVTMTLVPARSQVTITSGSSRIILRLIEGTFPNADGIIPKHYATGIVASRKALLEKLKAAKPVAKEHSNILHVTAKNGKLTLEVYDDGKCVFSDSIPVTLIGKEQDRLYNLVYLFDILNITKQERVIIDITNPHGLAGIRPEDDNEEHNYLYLVMPMSPNR